MPLIVREKLNEPAVTEAGESELIVGTGVVRGRSTDVDIPPPGGGLSTQTGTENKPFCAIASAGICAVSRVLLTYVVGRSNRSKFTAEVGTKPVPLTVSVNAGPLMGTLAGERDVIVGTGFVGGVLLPIIHSNADPLTITGLLTLHIVPTVGEIWRPTVA